MYMFDDASLAIIIEKEILFDSSNFEIDNLKLFQWLIPRIGISERTCDSTSESRENNCKVILILFIIMDYCSPLRSKKSKKNINY